MRRKPTRSTTIVLGPARRLPPPFVLVPLAVGFFSALAVDRALGDPPPPHAEPAEECAACTAPAAALAPPLRLGSVRVDGRGRLVAPLGDAVAVLTREPRLEAELLRLLEAGHTPYAATVLVEVGSGRVLAVAEHSTRGDAAGLALRPLAPAASVFKIVTSSALLEAGASLQSRVCTHGGLRRMQPELLVDNPRKDRACAVFFDVLPQSQNVAIAKLALKHLEPAALREHAQRWGFERALPMDVVVEHTPSPAPIPDDPFGFANASAGFGKTQLSAMHGALLASIVANDGVMVPLRFIDDVDGGALPPAPAPARVIDAAHARALAKMMTATVVSGTARRQFSTGARLPTSAAGKTGSLTDYDSGLDTSWFVGMAPAENPEVVVASVVVNTSKWHVKAPFVAKEALRAYFKQHAPPKKGTLVARADRM